MEISIKVEQHEKKYLENFIKTCEGNGFKITREGGGNMPNYSGYFAQLKGERWQKADTEKSNCTIDSVSERTYDPDYEEVDCDHYEYQQMPDDADEVCHLGIGIENCAHCYKNKALYVR